MDASTKAAIAKLSKQLSDLQDEVSRQRKGNGTAQLAHSSLQGQKMNVYDATGTVLRQTWGMQPDGTTATVTYNGPPPPEPSAPDVFPTISGCTATWDGLAQDDDVMPADFDHVEVHVSTISLFLPDKTTKQGIIPRVSGSFPVTGLTSGTTYYVRLVAVSTSDVSSPPSDQTSVVPIDPPAGGGGGDEVFPGIPDVSSTIVVAAYIDASGDARSSATVTWTDPTLNADGSPLDDLSYIEVQFRPTSPAGMAYRSVFVAAGVELATIPELIPGTEYAFQVRAVDTSGNQGAWSAPVTQTMAVDETAPGTPSAPTVAASLTAIQVTHDLTLAAGGNLPDDLDHLDVHVGTSSGFTPSSSTKVGTLNATKGTIATGFPVIATFPVSQTVLVYAKVVAFDKSGNASGASAAGSATALLIDSAHISSLQASKITAGTLGADVVVGARIKTADTGSRVELNETGIQAFDDDGNETLTVRDDDGSVEMVGQLSTGVSGRRIVINEDIGIDDPTIVFHPTDGTNEKVVWMEAHDGEYSNEATARIQTSVNNNNTCYSRVNFASGSLASQIISIDDDSDINSFLVAESSTSIQNTSQVFIKTANFYTTASSNMYLDVLGTDGNVSERIYMNAADSTRFISKNGWIFARINSSTGSSTSSSQVAGITNAGALFATDFVDGSHTSGWTNVALYSQWSNRSSSYVTAQTKRIPGGIVLLKLELARSSAGAASGESVFQVYPDYVPTKKQSIVVGCGGGVASGILQANEDGIFTCFLPSAAQRIQYTGMYYI